MRHWLRKTYGITLEFYQQMLLAQEGRCWICKRLPEECGHKYLHVDHCHETGTVRGLLCKPCNYVLGLARDNPEWLRSAAAYLARYEISDGADVYSTDDNAQLFSLLAEHPTSKSAA